jgi:ferredoxin
MSDHTKRLPTNVPGKWYVDDSCIDCDLCRETAPTVFRRDDDSGNSFVFHQPETEEELRLAEEARAGCPVEAIGNDNPSPVTPTPAPPAELAKAPEAAALQDLANEQHS